jgi:hypothetical protein
VRLPQHDIHAQAYLNTCRGEACTAQV